MSDPFAVAAARVKNSARPDGGRQEGLLTTLPEKMATDLYTLPARAGQAAVQYGETGEYDPAPIMESALTAMTGGMPFAQAGALGSAGGKIKAALPMDEASRMGRAAEQGYTIDAFKGGQPNHWDSLPEYFGNGKVVPGTENRIPKELTSIDSPNANYAGFFSNSPEVANRFASNFEYGGVWPTKLKFENPLVIDAKGRHAADFQFESLGRERGTLDQVNAFKNAFAPGSKHDGVILKNTKDEGDVYVPRSPKQIRSKFAAFDPANKDSAKLLASILAGAGLGAGTNDPQQ
jgi:hypothetical protein